MDYNYSLKVSYSDRDEKFIATSPEFGDQMARVGNTREEAVSDAVESMRLLIEDYEEEGDDLPSVQKASEYSGNFSLRMPKSLHKQLSLLAESEGVSVNQYIISKLSDEVGLVHNREQSKKERSTVE